MYKKLILALALSMTVMGCKFDLENPMRPQPVIEITTPDTVIETTSEPDPIVIEEPEPIQFKADLQWLNDHFWELQEYRRGFTIKRDFGLAVRFDHFRDPETFNKPGGEGIIKMRYGLAMEDDWKFDQYTEITYDPEKIQITSEHKPAPPEFADPRVGGWVSDVHISHIHHGANNPIIRELPSAEEKQKKFEEIAFGLYMTGKSSLIKRNGEGAGFSYRYLGGGDAYIIIHRNTSNENDADFVAIKVTSENL